MRTALAAFAAVACGAALVPGTASAERVFDVEGVIQQGLGPATALVGTFAIADVAGDAAQVRLDGIALGTDGERAGVVGLRGLLASFGTGFQEGLAIGNVSIADETNSLDAGLVTLVVRDGEFIGLRVRAFVLSNLVSTPVFIDVTCDTESPNGCELPSVP